MPKQRITKDDVIQTAFELAREGGLENVLVKKIAERIGCSVHPIYCYCENMDVLKDEVVAYAGKHLEEYLKKHIDPKNMFQSMGIAHANYAKKEPYLYRIYFLRKRDNVTSFKDIYECEANPMAAQLIAKEHGITIEQARQLHLNMMIYNVGLSFMMTSVGANIDIDEITTLLNQAHSAFSSKKEI